MTEHRHEWEWTKKPFGGENTQAFLTGFFCKQKDCSAALNAKQAEALLNAAECLTAEDAESSADMIYSEWGYRFREDTPKEDRWMTGQDNYEALIAYAERRK